MTPLSLPIRLLPLTSTVSYADVLAVSESPLVACDFYIDEIEGGDSVPGGYARGRVVNVDHHAPTQRMTRPISSGNLALELVAALGMPPSDAVVVINHTDCDSILSAGIVAGRLPPNPALGVAAVAADHTGEENELADLLQALDHHRDVELSLRSALDLLEGRPMSRAITKDLAGRSARRDAARAAVERGALVTIGPVAFGQFDETVDGEFFPALLPEAVAVLLAYPRETDAARWNMKVRLGPAAPEGFSLHDIPMASLDPLYGGRWNAGANRRGGGTATPPDRYAIAFAHLVTAALASRMDSPERAV